MQPQNPLSQPNGMPNQPSTPSGLPPQSTVFSQTPTPPAPVMPVPPQPVAQPAFNPALPNPVVPSQNGGMRIIQPMRTAPTPINPALPLQPPSAPAPTFIPPTNPVVAAAPTPFAVPTTVVSLPQPSVPQPVVFPPAPAVAPAAVVQQPLLPGQSGEPIATPMAAAQSVAASAPRPMATIIMVFGAVIALFAAQNLFNWIRIVSGPYGKTAEDILGLTLNAVELLLGIGIIMRREIARSMYVSVATILLLLSLFGTYSYLKASHTINVDQKEVVSQIQKDITMYQNDSSIPTSERSQLVSELQNNKNAELESLTKGNTRLLWPLIEGYLITIAPIVFLTRPAVRKNFK
jgi:hypothetical protein